VFEKYGTRHFGRGDGEAGKLQNQFFTPTFSLMLTQLHSLLLSFFSLASKEAEK
jgi:hypothetical protein